MAQPDKIDPLFRVDFKSLRQEPTAAPAAPAPGSPTVDPLVSMDRTAFKLPTPTAYTMSIEDRGKRIGFLNDWKTELKSSEIPMFSSEETQSRIEEIDKELYSLTAPEATTAEMQADMEGIESVFGPFGFLFPGFFVGRTIATTGRLGLMAAASRAAVTTGVATASDLGIEMVADPLLDIDPWMGMAAIAGLSIATGTFVDTFIEARTLRLLNKTVPNFFAKNFDKIVPPNSKNISNLVKHQIKDLMAKVDQGDTVALREVQDLLRKSIYKDHDTALKASQKLKDSLNLEVDALKPPKQVLKKSFADLNDDDLQAVQDLARKEAFQEFDQGFDKLKNRINNRMAMEQYRNHPIAAITARIGRGGGMSENQLNHMIGKAATESLKKRFPNIVAEGGTMNPIRLAVDYNYNSVEEMLYDFIQMPTLKRIRKSVNSSMDYDWSLVYLDEFYSRMGGKELKMWEKLGGKKLVQRVRQAVNKDVALVGGPPKTIRRVLDDVAFMRKVGKRGAKLAGKVVKVEERLTALLRAQKLRESSKTAKELIKLNGKLKTALRNTSVPEEYQLQIHNFLKPFFKNDKIATEGVPDLVDFLNRKSVDKVPMAKIIREEFSDILDLPYRVESMRDLTVEQYRRITQLSVDLQTMGKNERRIGNVAKGQVINEYTNKIKAKADKVHRRKKEDPTQRDYLSKERGWFKKKGESAVDSLSKWMGELKRPEFVIRELDGWDEFGEAQKMFRAAKKAEDINHGVMKTLTGRWDEVIKKYGNRVGKRIDAKYWSKQMEDSKGYFKSSRETMLTIAAHMGNKHNMTAMLNSLMDAKGQPMSEIVINRFLRENMSKADNLLVEDLWKITDEMYGMLNDTYKRMRGVTLPKVDKYFPIMPDYKFATKKINESIEDVFMELPHLRKLPRRMQQQFLKARTGGTSAIRLDFDSFAKHIRDVGHTVSHWEVTDDLSKIINDAGFKDTVTANLGRPKYDVLKTWVDDLMQPAPTDSTFMRRTRANVTVAMLGFKVSTALVQPLSAVAAIPRVGAKNLVVASTKFMFNPRGFVRAIQAASPQMAARNKTWHRELNEMLTSRQFKHKLGRFGSLDKNIFFSLIRVGDVLGSYTTWYAGYLRAMKKFGGDANKAIDWADQSVRLTQPQSMVKDLPKIMRSGNEFKRSLTMFYSYYSVLHNQGTEIVRRAGAGNISKLEAITALHWMYIVPPMIRSVMQERTDITAMSLLKGTTTHIAGGIPVFRDLISSQVMGYDYTVSPIFSAPTALLGAIKTGAKAAKGEDLGIGDYYSPVNLAGYTFGLPSGQAMTLVRGFHALANDRRDVVNYVDVFLKQRESTK